MQEETSRVTGDTLVKEGFHYTQDQIKTLSDGQLWLLRFANLTLLKQTLTPIFAAVANHSLTLPILLQKVSTDER